MTARRFVAKYRWDDRAWIVQFREPDIATFGRTLASAKRFARSALAVHLEVDDLVASGIEVVDEVRLPGTVAADLETLVARRAEADRLRSDVADATRRVAVHLRAQGLSTRDVGELLGVTGARIAQIEREASGGA